ncbi:MAG: hypothetical protein ABI643_02695 [Candidatus Doudnabacteria bacterium]
MRKLVLSVVFMLTSVGIASAQTPVDSWKTAAECVAAPEAPFYRPSVVTPRRLGKNEIIRGHPTGGCFEMKLPDRMNKRGFVRIEQGREFVYNFTTRKILRLAECNNDVFEFSPFLTKEVAPAPAIKGDKGDTGKQGDKGDKGDKGEPGAPAIPTTVSDETSPATTKPIVGVGIGYVFGSVNTDFTYPDPKRGDVPQKHKFAAPVLTVRVDQSAHKGAFGSVTASFLGNTSDQLYQDLQGNWLSKKRDSDTSRDKLLQIRGGYKLAVGDVLSIGVSLDFDRTCFCETYFAQNTTTVTERSFQTYGVGVEASGSTKSDDHRLTVRAGGTLGLGGSRDKWTTQHYNGDTKTPAIDFPKVTDEQEQAKLNRLGADVDVQAIGRVHVFANVSWSHYKSVRPTSHTAHESTSSMATIVGVKVSF